MRFWLGSGRAFLYQCSLPHRVKLETAWGKGVSGLEPHCSGAVYARAPLAVVDPPCTAYPTVPKWEAEWSFWLGNGGAYLCRCSLPHRAGGRPFERDRVSRVKSPYSGMVYPTAVILKHFSPALPSENDNLSRSPLEVMSSFRK